ncbi:hypothetical protein L1987_72997 [Smallanthus sonchifolius]|uniref:Uncharacterized protein n=1 Tax=Smallanthus sonchifolius TaxID=185202 RepID=A0ACB9AWT0_9ASTR|nr:hypothetical protein L1987_72997 [Smallanthus sonchifolius]
MINPNWRYIKTPPSLSDFCSPSLVRPTAIQNFTIKVRVTSSWQDTVKTVLKSVQGVTAFRMEDDRKVNISGQNLNDNANGGGGYYLYPGYGGYNGYGNVYGNGGYGHNYDYPRYAKNYAYKHLECSGNAQDCNGHHTEQPKNSDKSSLSISKKITESGEDPIPIPGEDAPKCCILM